MPFTRWTGVVQFDTAHAHSLTSKPQRWRPIADDIIAGLSVLAAVGAFVVAATGIIGKIFSRAFSRLAFWDVFHDNSILILRKV